MEDKILDIVKEIKTRKTNHMTALRKYKTGSEESFILKARISECNQITGLINDLNLGGVSKRLDVDREKYANKKAAKSIKEFCEHVMHPDSDLHKDADEWIDNKLK